MNAAGTFPSLRSFRLAAKALLSFAVAACVVTRPPPPPPAHVAAFDRVMSLDDFDRALLVRAIFDESNRVRIAHHIPPLRHLPALDDAADEQATYMALTRHSGHDNPIPGEHRVSDRVAMVGLFGKEVGENALMLPAQRPREASIRDYTYAECAAVVVEAWMASPPHRANLLAPRFVNLGCGARLGNGIPHSDQWVYATQVFFLPFEDISDLKQ